MWKDILGHTSQKELLKGYLAMDKVPHAFLFSGPMGLGKTRVAIEFFKALNCLERPGDPCDACRNCVKANSLSHPDLVMLGADEGWIQVKEVRAVIGDIALKPFEARTRVIIMEPAERLNKASANAILKTLEEPPQGTAIILVSHKPTLLLPTIVSRCQIIRFTPLDTSEITGSCVDPALLRLAAGSIGALPNLDGEDSAYIRGEMVNIVQGGDPFDLLGRYFSGANASKDAAATVLIVAESILRDILVLYNGGDQIISEELRAFPVRQMSLAGIEDIARCIHETRRGMDENITLKVAMAELLIMLRDSAVA